MPREAVTPNVLYLSKEEKEMLEKRADQLLETQDISGLAKLVEIYPLSAQTLDTVKRNFGLNFLLENKINLANAVEAYGEAWLKE